MELRRGPAHVEPPRYIRNLLPAGKYKFQPVAHHYSHACGGYFTSPFEEAAIVVVDGVGDLDTVTVWKAEGRRSGRCTGSAIPTA